MKSKVYLLIISLLAIIITFGGISELTSKAVSPWYVGDVNEDGSVDGTDASMILQAYGEIGAGRRSDIPIDAADANHDGVIDGTDAGIVLRMYAEASDKKIEYEVIKKEVKPKDVLKFIGTSWLLHTTASLSEDNLYPEKNYIQTNNVIAIVDKLEDSWYTCYVDSSLNKAFIRIGQTHLDYFTKIGTFSYEDIIAIMDVTTTSTSTTMTTTKTTTTTKKTTESTTTSTTTRKTTTTTSTTMTTTITHTTITTTVTSSIADIPTYKKWQCVEFTGKLCNVRTSTKLEGTDNVHGYLGNKDFCFLKDYVGNGWYEICFSNSLEESKYYIQISKENERFFNIVDSKTFMFTGESWNVRSSREFIDDTNVVLRLTKGDVIAVITTYDDGWAKIWTNKSLSRELYVVINPLEILNTK